MGWVGFTVAIGGCLAAFNRFLFPNVLFEPPLRFKVGRPEDFPAGVVDERFKETRGVWVVNQEGRLYALIAICTHLGCPPNWLTEQNKFKCPCHGSGYYKNGVNFEGPTPRPLERAAISVDPQDGQLVVDKGRKFLFEAGQWDDPGVLRLGRIAEGNRSHMGMLDKLQKGITKSQVWKSIFRVGIPTDNRKRALAMLGNVVLHLHPVKVKKSGIRMSYTWCMGGTSFFLFLVETITGLLLMFYYRPTVEYAYVDMVDLREAAAFGIMRELHRWGAHAMVITVWLHMFRVFMTGSYKPPREFNWNVGVILLVLTLLLSFTGYLLPWDQLAIWAITVGSNMARATPFLGHEGPGAALLSPGRPASDPRR